MGDLNVDGSSGPDNDDFDLADGKPTPSHITAGMSEWERLFSPNSLTSPTKLFTCGADAFIGGSGICNLVNSRLMTDAWAFEHPTTDSGTASCNGKKGQCASTDDRLDYILHNHPVRLRDSTPYLCPSHLQRLWADHQDLGPEGAIAGWDNGTPYSDHLAVFGDFAFSQHAQCNPIEKNATEPQLGPTFGALPVSWEMEGSGSACCHNGECGSGESCLKGICDTSGAYCSGHADCSESSCLGWCSTGFEQDRVFPITLEFLRQHVWFKIPEDDNGNGIDLDPKDIGTISIGVPRGHEDAIDIRVYQAQDLSWPIREAHKDTVTYDDWVVDQYLLNKPPYYVRVSAKNGVGQSSVIFRKNQCTDPYSDVCLLTPGVPVRYGWPGPDKYNYAWDYTADPSDPSDLSGAACSGSGTPANAQSPFHYDYMYFRFFSDSAVNSAGIVDPDVRFAIENTENSQFDLWSENPRTRHPDLRRQ